MPDLSRVESFSDVGSIIAFARSMVVTKCGIVKPGAYYNHDNA